jgi:nitrous oxidase accessory protein NosD
MSNYGTPIFLPGNNHTVTHNNIVGNGYPDEDDIFGTEHAGIMLHFVADCMIAYNNLIQLRGYAILIGYQAENCTIFHNNFADNMIDFGNRGSASSNVWSDAILQPATIGVATVGTDIAATASEIRRTPWT